MLGRPRTGAAQAALADALALLAGLFHGAGHAPLAPPHLFLAETLLDLYGEDLRARAFVCPDQGRGNELILRPDFTVPVALAHAQAGWNLPGAYAYQGPVFRSQPPGEGRPLEYLQAGIERFGDRDATRADAKVFALLYRGLAALGVTRPQATIGDLSIPFALLNALDMPADRRKALRRHFWRPTRFQALLARAEQPPPRSASREALLSAAASPDMVADMIATAAEPVGMRTVAEIARRTTRLAAEAQTATMPSRDVSLLARMLSVSGPAPQIPARLRDLTDDAGVDISEVIDRFEMRLAAIEDEGIPSEGLHFHAAFGRSLEYYDGFVFELRAPGRPAYPPLAGGGRYDAMTVRLGAPSPVPAIGGMIRPEAVLEIRA